MQWADRTWIETISGIKPLYACFSEELATSGAIIHRLIAIPCQADSAARFTQLPYAREKIDFCRIILQKSRFLKFLSTATLKRRLQKNIFESDPTPRRILD